MKQQKKPLFLVTTAATLVVVLLGVNMSQYLRDPNRIREHPAPDPDAIAAVQPAPEDATVFEMMDSRTRPFDALAKASASEVPVKSSIELVRPQIRPDDQFRTDSTSRLWWTKNSKQRHTSEERARLYAGPD